MQQLDECSDYKNYRKARQDIENHEGSIVHYRWRNLELAWQAIYGANRDVLLAFLTSANDDQQIEIMQMMSDDNRDGFGLVGLLLFNFLQSANALANQCIRLQKKQENTEFIEEWKNQVQELTKIPEVSLIQDLRNFFAHVDIPPIVFTTRIDNHDGNGQLSTYFSLSSEKSRTSKSWEKTFAPLSRKYLEENNPVKIEDLVRGFDEAENTFMDWLSEEYFKVHDDILAERDRALAELNLRFFGTANPLP